MKRVIGLFFGLIAISVLPAAAADQVQSDEVHKAKLTVAAPTVVGDKTLKPGEYKFECRMVDGKHMMFFIDDKGAEAAKAPCAPTTIDSKVATTEYRTRNAADGTKTLLSVRIKNETIAHTVGQN